MKSIGGVEQVSIRFFPDPHGQGTKTETLNLLNVRPLEIIETDNRESEGFFRTRTSSANPFLRQKIKTSYSLKNNRNVTVNWGLFVPAISSKTPAS